MKRSMLEVSQEKLAEALGLTFQQVQKYERGTNRVSASRLFQIAEILGETVSYFYQNYSDEADAGAASAKMLGLADNAQEDFDHSNDILYSKETISLLKVYYSLEDEKKRKDLLKIIKSMVDSMGSPS